MVELLSNKNTISKLEKKIQLLEKENCLLKLEKDEHHTESTKPGNYNYYKHIM